MRELLTGANGFIGRPIGMRPAGRAVRDPGRRARASGAIRAYPIVRPGARPS